MIATATRRIRWSAVLAATTIVFSVFSSVPGAAPAAAVVPVAEAIPVVPVELVADRVDVGRSVMQVAAAGTATSGAVAPYGSAVGVSRTDTRGRWVSAGSDSLGIAIAEPRIGLAKEAYVTNIGDGTYQVTYEYVVENFGDVPLAGLVLADNVGGPFGGSYFIVGLSATDGAAAADRSLVANVEYPAVDNILADGQVLQPGESGAVAVSFTVTPATPLTRPMTYNTTAFVSGTHELLMASDQSTSGLVPDADGSGDPGDDQTPTAVTFNPMIAGFVVLDGSSPEVLDVGQRTYDVTLAYRVWLVGGSAVTSLGLYAGVSDWFPDATVTDFTVTSPSWTVNEGWTGMADSNMLASGQRSDPGSTGFVTISFTVAPGANLGPYETTGLEVRGQVADTPSYDTGGRMTVTIPPFPSIGLAKDATVVNEGVGMYGVTYDYVVENLGNVRVEDLVLVDDVLGLFGAAATGFTVGTVTRDGYKALNGNEGWDGTGSNILSPGQVLEQGESGVVSVSFTVELGTGSYSTAATVTGTHELIPVEDASTDGTDPDPDGDGVPDEGFETVVTLDAPSAGVTLTRGDPDTEAMGVDDDGLPTYRVTLDYDVSAVTDVTSVQLYANVLGWFPDGTVTDPTVTSEGWTVNEGWTGGADSNMLAGGQVLEPEADVSVQVSFTVAPGTDLGPHMGGGLVMRGVIESGPTYDALDGTVVTFPPEPVIGLAKEVSISGSGDTYLVTYEYVVENFGNVPLTDLVLVDDIFETFGDIVGGSAASAGTREGHKALGPNQFGWDGMGTNILTPGQVLEPGESGTVGVVFTVTPATVPVTYRTQAYVSANRGSDEVMDQSTSGLVPDADGNGNPGDDLTQTVVTLEAPTAGIQPFNGEPRVLYVGEGTYSVTIDYLLVRTTESTVTSLELYASVLDWFPDATVTDLTVVSGSWTVNEGWTGEADSNMLASGQVFNLGGTGAVEIRFRVAPGSDLGPYQTTGLEVRGQVGDSASYDSGSGFLVALSPRPMIGLAKDAAVVNMGDGTYGVTYEFVVENLGDVPLENLVLGDDVLELFGTAATGFTVGTVTREGYKALNGDEGWGGTSNVLVPGQVLEPRESGVVSVSFTVTPTSPYDVPLTSDTTATVTGTHELVTVEDDSTDGTDPDPDGDDDSTNNGDVTVVTFNEGGAIGVMKTLGSVVEGGEGAHKVTFEYVVSNTGDVNVNNLWLVDGVNSQFPGVEVSGFAATVTDGTDRVTVNESWDGTADSNMFSDAQSLLRGTSVTVRGSFMVTPGASLEYPGGFATVSGSTPSGATVESVSDVVPVDLRQPVIGLAKEATVVNNGDGTYEVTYDFVVENFGNVDLTDVAIYDRARFVRGASGFTVRDGSLMGNDQWSGDRGTSILEANQGLSVGESGTVSVSFTVTTRTNLDPGDSPAEATGTYESVTVEDDSTDGTVPDPDGDGDPTNNGDVTVVEFVESEEIVVTKTLRSVVEGAAGAYEVTFDYMVSNSGDVNVNSLSLVDGVMSQFPGVEVSGFAATVTDGTDRVTVNEDWDGTADSNMFSDAQSLLRGTSVAVQGSFMVTPGASLEEYPGGFATVSGTTPSGAPVETESGVVPVDLRQPVIGLAKKAMVVNNGNGQYEVTYEFVVENSGNVPLVDLTLIDNVFEIFGAAATGFTVGTGTPDGYEALNGNDGWDGTGSNILGAGQVLEAGESGVVSVSFTVTPTSPHEVPLTYNTAASVTGTHESGTVADVSTDGADPDPDGDGDPTNNGDVTVVTFNEGGAIGVMKTLGSVVEGGEGAYEVTFEYVVSNTGDVNVNNLWLVDGVNSQFPGVEVSGFAATVTDGTDRVTVNEDWDGTADSNMFSDAQSLLRGTSVTVQGSFMVTPGASPEEYPGGFATVSGTTPSGAPVENTSDVVPVDLRQPVIGLAKEASVVNNGDGTYEVTYDFVVENFGNVDLTDVAIYDRAGVFGGTSGFTVRDGSLMGNDDWSGDRGTSILEANQVLSVGESGTVSVSFTVAPRTDLDPGDSPAEATGGWVGGEVSDGATDGTVPDPDGDGDPTNNGDVTVVEFVESEEIGVVKTLDSVVEGVAGAYEVTFDYVVSNTGDVNVNNLRLVDDVISQFPGVEVSGFAATVTDGGDVVTVNEGWVGTAGSNMFSDGQSLLRGTSVTVQGSFMVTPGTSLEYPGGLATVSGSTPSGAPVESVSDVVPVDLTQAVIGLAKEATVVNNGNGQYEVTYEFVVENSGNVPLVDLTLIDNVFETFGTTATGFTAGTVTREGYEALNGNEGWNGTSNVLVPGQVLEPGESGVVSVSFTVTPTSPHDVPLTYDTTATVTGTHELMTVEDVSTDGTDPDPDGDDDPTNNGDATVVTFNEAEAVSVTKTLGSVGENVAGAYEVTFDYVVSNSGDVNVNNLSLVDDVISQFPGVEVSGFAATVTDGTDLVTVNEGWDGTAGSNMFSDGQSLLRGTSVTVQGSFMVTPGTSLEYPGGLATVSGSTPSGAPVEDMSDVVPVDLTQAVIGLAKEATVVNNGNGQYEVTYEFVVENLGNVPLGDLTLIDNVVETFGTTATGFTAGTVTREGYEALNGNDAWDGTDSNILVPGQVLEPGESGVVSVSFTVTPTSPHDVPLTYDTTAEVTGTHESVTVADDSTDGSDPDPNDDDDPTNNGDVTVVTFNEAEAVSVTKTLGPVGESVAGAYEVTFDYVVSNSGDVNVNNLSLVDDVIGQFPGAEVSGFVATVTEGDVVTVNEGWDGTAGSNMFSDGQSLLRGTSVTVRGSFMVTPGTSLEYPGGLATVSGSTPSGAPVEDMSDSVGVSFESVESFDLELVVTDSGDAYSGDTLSYVFSTTNLGPGVAYGPLVLVVDVPVGLSIVSASGSNDSCVIEGQVVTCTRVGDLGVGASSDVTVLTTVVAADGVSLAVSGSVMSQGGAAEGSVTNNADTATRVVGALPTTGFVFSWLWLLGALVMVVGSGVVWSANRRREDALL